MAQIGLFNREGAGWVGDFATLKLSLSGVEIVPNTAKTDAAADEKKPDYLMKWFDKNGGINVTFGQGWDAKSGNGREYINLRITDPTVANFECRLFPNTDGTASLLV
ncbi:uncharacterized protein (DUF736 family) [Azospirillum brasilense]|nr:uncharacterized protein (DUF736 family) [Azospirillum brasilense]